ncbi:MAG: class I SAM-dependent methyltransferase [Actinomycetota bacterium]|nr:class I SAM-dependent methyltransferase [Actinomycetota bacterium]
MSSTSEHWDQIYTTRAIDSLSWFEAAPDLSLELVQTDGTPASVIDVGAGESLLADALAALGVSDITLLDLSSAALDAVRARVAPHSITTICADVLGWEPDRTWQVWHDRAVFHFLTEPAQRTSYVERAATAVEPGGIAVIATFAPDGPTMCSGLDVRRADARSIWTPRRQLLSASTYSPLAEAV